MGDESGHLVLVGDVAAQRGGGHAVLGEAFGGLRRGDLVDVADDDGRARTAEHAGDLEADALCAAGDHGVPAVQQSHVSPPWLVAIPLK